MTPDLLNSLFVIGGALLFAIAIFIVTGWQDGAEAAKIDAEQARRREAKRR